MTVLEWCLSASTLLFAVLWIVTEVATASSKTEEREWRNMYMRAERRRMLCFDTAYGPGGLEEQRDDANRHVDALRADMEWFEDVLELARLERDEQRDASEYWQAQYWRQCCKPSSADVYQNRMAYLVGDASLTTLALGVAGEAGEVADEVKKVVGHGRTLDKEKLVLELGDVLWYVSAMAGTLGYRLSDVMARNTEKLSKRYPSGFVREDTNVAK